MALRIKKGDTVEVIAGDDKGSRGEVLSVDRTRDRVVVQGLNRAWKHVRPSRQNPQGGRLHLEQPIHISNVMVVSPKMDRPTRVKFVVGADGRKSRVDLNGNEIDVIKKA